MSWQRFTVLLPILLATSLWSQHSASLPAAHSPLPAVVPANRPAIGVALEGGGALGLAHIGVLQWLEEHHVPVDRIAGTSMGSLVGGLYAAGNSPAKMRSIAESSAFLGVFTLQTPYADSSFRRRQDRREIAQFIEVGFKHGPGVRDSLLSDRGVNEFLTTNFFAYNLQGLDYNRTPIPFRCVATDLNSLKTVTFDHGPMPQAVRASISIPGVFPPAVDSSGHPLVDGGILDNLPTDVLKQDLHAGIILAVHLQDSPLTASDTSSIVGVLNRAFSAGITRNVEQAELLADLVIEVPVGNFSSTDYDKAGALVDLGYRSAEVSRAALLHYALDDAGWKAYLADRDSRRLPTPGRLAAVQVAGANPAANESVQSTMKPLQGQPISTERTLKALIPTQSNGDLEASYELLSPSGAPYAPASGILVHLRPDPVGPPYLLIGMDLAASTSNISRGELSLRFVDQNLGGFGSELRATARIGFMTDISAEYYRKLSPSGYFLQPSSRVLREPIYIWQNQKRIAERFQQNLSSGVEAGRTFSSQMQISADWQASYTRWSLRTGADGSPYLAGTAQTGMVHFRLDKAFSGTVSPDGFRLSAAAGALFHAAGSENAPVVHLAFNRSRPWRETNIFGLSGEVNSYLRRNVAQPYRFTLGGPMRLSASSFDEFRGTDTYLARSGYMHRIAALPTGLGQGLYTVLAYEGGEIWSPEAHAILRQDGIVGLVGSTPIGVITIGASVGDAGHRKLFVTLGRWF